MQSDQADLQTRPSVDWPLISFFALAYAIGWGFIPVLSAIAGSAGLPDWIALSHAAEALEFNGIRLPAPGWLIYLITRLQDFAFSIAGVVMIAVVAGRAGLARLGRRLLQWRVGGRWWLAAAIPFGLYLLATVVSGELGTFTFNGSVLWTILFSAEAGLLVTLLLRGPMGEELGLRGFALPRLQRTHSPFFASAVIGALWAAWHLPVLLNRDAVSIVAFLLLAFMLSFIFTWLFNGGGGSLLPGLLFHALQNTEEMFETVFPGLAGSDWELLSTLGLLLIGIVIARVVYRGGSRAAAD